MSGVLAAMDLALRAMNGGETLTVAEFEQAHAGMKRARATVANLIDAANRMAAFRDSEYVPNVAFERLDAATARAQGKQP